MLFHTEEGFAIVTVEFYIGLLVNNFQIFYLKKKVRANLFAHS